MAITARQYIESFDVLGSKFICIPAPSSISGSGYAVGRFQDGAILTVGKSIVDFIEGDVSYGIVETLSKVGRLLAGLSQDTRAEQIQDLGIKPNHAGEYELGGSRWSAAGEYLGLLGHERFTMIPA